MFNQQTPPTYLHLKVHFPYEPRLAGFHSAFFLQLPRKISCNSFYEPSCSPNQQCQSTEGQLKARTSTSDLVSYFLHQSLSANGSID